MILAFPQIVVLAVTVFLVYALYKELFSPPMTFFICTIVLLTAGVIGPDDFLKGLSNQQIIVIFLLMLVTTGIRNIYGTELFSRIFHAGLSDKQFLMRMMLVASSLSTFINNTPIVAFLIPYVKDWANRNDRPPSKFLIPLSFATILGGMVTVIGTSTSLVLNGLIAEYKLPLLGFSDFFFLGILVTLVGWIYLYTIGYQLLPARVSQIANLKEYLKEYIVETEIFPGSTMIGKSVKDAGLRNLEDIFLVEIIRGSEVISPVSPDMKLEQGDCLFFSGNTASIGRLIKEDNGLKASSQVDMDADQFAFIEAVVPANSDLIGQRIKDSDFRRRFNASIIAIHRHGKQVSGKVGEMILSGGDFLLLLGNDKPLPGNQKDLVYVSLPEPVASKKTAGYKWVGILSILILLASVGGFIPLFSASIIILSGLVFTGILGVNDIRRELDLGLLMVLICSLALGIALEKSGTAALLAGWIIRSGTFFGPVGVVTMLFMATVILTSLITNAAAVSIVFPIAMSIAEQMSLPYTPFFATIAFAASGSFMTPIGYQTNLMIFGPGDYKFRDFIRVGTPFTILYVLLCVGFIAFFYNLISI